MRLTVLACLVGWFTASQARELIDPTGFSAPVQPVTIDWPVQWLKAAPSVDLPLVVADAHTFTVLSHYAPFELKARMVYLGDIRISP